MASAASLYHNVIRVTTDYLGPAAPRFIDRQIHNHLGKEPHKLAAHDMPVLIEWSKIAIALLTDDRQIVLSYVEDLNTLYKHAK